MESSTRKLPRDPARHSWQALAKFVHLLLDHEAHAKVAKRHVRWQRQRRREAAECDLLRHLRGAPPGVRRVCTE